MLPDSSCSGIDGTNPVSDSKGQFLFFIPLIKFMKKLNLVLFWLLGACATPVMYKKAGLMDINGESFRTGYSDEGISSNRYHVKFQGNGHNTTTDVYQKFLRRAAEVTIENKHRWFFIENAAHGVGGYGAIVPWPNYEGDVIFAPSATEKTFDRKSVMI